MRIAQSRRQFLTGLSWACTSGLFGASSALAAEGPLETTTVRIANRHSLCNAPQHVAEELLRGEGFTEIRYIDTGGPVTAEAIARGKVDFSMATHRIGSPHTMPADPSFCWPGFTSAASSCLRGKASIVSAI
jgi:ABC-type nitrate/sulfonate/bicarbonate transport system substrate-binding protein